MAQLRVKDVDHLRDAMRESKRVVPHSVRSLAELVGVNRSKIGFLLTGDRDTVDEAEAQRISEVLGRAVDDLFVPAQFPFVHGNEVANDGPNEDRPHSPRGRDELG